MKDLKELPQYLRIADELRAKLRSLSVGAPFETESALTEAYGVSRGTIRQALNVLVREGLLVRTRGRGSFRAQPPGAPFRICLAENLVDSARRIGTHSGVAHLSVTLVCAPAKIADMLQIPHGEKVRRVSRVRTIDGKPCAYCVGYLRADVVPPLYKRDFRTSLSDTVVNALHMHVAARSCECRAVEADEEVSAALSIPLHTPVLRVCFLCRTVGSVPMLADIAYFPTSQSLQFDIIIP